MLEFIFGFKTVAMFDFWIIEHVLAGLSVGCLMNNANRNQITRIYSQIDQPNKTITRFDLFGLLFLGYSWETIEHYLESGIAGEVIKFWFQGIEFWSNRIIADPLMLIIGYFIALKYPLLVKPARILSCLWLFIHIFIFPHSMYLHTIF